jgi:hypothetical protein
VGTARRFTLMLSCLLAALVVAAPAPAIAKATGEELVKIELIERFTHFVDWPPDVLGQAQPRFVLCIAGNGPVADSLPESAPDRFKERPTVFRRIRASDDLTGCHLLFIGASDAGHLSTILSAAATRPILTVADMDGAAERGVIINLYRQGRRVLFEINRAAGQKSTLKISARLLQLARIVGPKAG